MRLGPLALFLFTLLSAASVSAQERVPFPDHHTRFDWPHGILTGAALAGGVTFYLIGAPDAPRWTGRNGLDDAGRVAALATRDERQTASTVSDVGFFAMLAFPIVVDSVIVAGLVHESWETALHTGLISAEVLGLGLLLSMGTSRPIARQRPFTYECAGDPGYAEACDGDGSARNTSFLSGHALMTFASAGVICAHHTVLRLYGELAADVAACGTALAVAGAVSVLRMSADRHFLTDVLLGSGLGLLVGWGAPALLHYQPWAQVQITPSAPGADAGLSAIAIW